VWLPRVRGGHTFFTNALPGLVEDDQRYLKHNDAQRDNHLDKGRRRDDVHDHSLRMSVPDLIRCLPSAGNAGNVAQAGSPEEAVALGVALGTGET
jgi:hypothetical protein